jgi:NTP pyrophosphatase (non-canonical NTP hydrolase)
MTFDELQQANKQRSKEWGEPGFEFHLIELGGEVGECLNAGKKHLRYLKGMKGVKGGTKDDIYNLTDELADVVICAALVANNLGIDLGDIVQEKFNATSVKHDYESRSK